MPLILNRVTKGTFGKKGTHGPYQVQFLIVPATKTTPNYTNYEFMKNYTNYEFMKAQKKR